MPEGLHNASPTFCRMMKAAPKDQVGKNVLSYIDDSCGKQEESILHLWLSRNLLQYARSLAQAQYKEMCIWGNKRQSAWMLSLHERHRSESR
jgi:hypothetical protein